MKTIAKNTKSLETLHFQHEIWNRELAFYHDEVKIFQHRLSEIASKNTLPEVEKQISHFQNQLAIQRQEIEFLTHEIKVHEQWLAEYAEKHNKGIEYEHFADHKGMTERMNKFLKIYTDFKHDFIHFLEEWM